MLFDSEIMDVGTRENNMQLQRIVADTLRKHTHTVYNNISRLYKCSFSDENFDIFPISAQNIGCGYTLEPPQ